MQVCERIHWALTFRNKRHRFLVRPVHFLTCFIAIQLISVHLQRGINLGTLTSGTVALWLDGEAGVSNTSDSITGMVTSTEKAGKLNACIQTILLGLIRPAVDILLRYRHVIMITLPLSTVIQSISSIPFSTLYLSSSIHHPSAYPVQSHRVSQARGWIYLSSFKINLLELIDSHFVIHGLQQLGILPPWCPATTCLMLPRLGGWMKALFLFTMGIIWHLHSSSRSHGLRTRRLMLEAKPVFEWCVGSSAGEDIHPYFFLCMTNWPAWEGMPNHYTQHAHNGHLRDNACLWMQRQMLSTRRINPKKKSNPWDRRCEANWITEA